LSLPMRERGLKQIDLDLVECPARVAPHAGAWIETVHLYRGLVIVMSLPMRERGAAILKLPFYIAELFFYRRLIQ
ncbi:hypothetical protein, partial [Desulfobacula sp.]|uniref:hypothetical protein n=1 Tax=Desulfobacula sp. TaxID=2593537 RepID=UPI0026050AB8